MLEHVLYFSILAILVCCGSSSWHTDWNDLREQTWFFLKIERELTGSIFVKRRRWISWRPHLHNCVLPWRKNWMESLGWISLHCICFDSIQYGEWLDSTLYFTWEVTVFMQKFPFEHMEDGDAICVFHQTFHSKFHIKCCLSFFWMSTENPESYCIYTGVESTICKVLVNRSELLTLYEFMCPNRS